MATAKENESLKVFRLVKEREEKLLDFGFGMRFSGVGVRD